MHRTAFATAARRCVFWIVAIAAWLSAGGPARASDAKVERDARALQKSAVEEDYLNMNYAGAMRKLQTALSKCGTDKCGASVKATLLRDLGAMQVLSGSADDGKANFARALQLDSSIDLDPAYKNAMLDGVWNDAKKRPKASSPGAVASGDFSHSPPAEALVRTPLPIYVEYPAGDPLGRVLVKYKGADMADWKAVELKKLGDGYGGLIPCKDVTQGTMQYFIQGFDPRNEPVAMSGSRTAPFTVEVTPQISGPPPSLPGRPPPSPCGQAEAAPVSAAPDCPPDFPGCNAPKKDVGAQCAKDDECSSGSCADAKCVDKKSDGQDCESDGECSSGSCSDGKCSDKKGSGAYCERDDECSSDQCEDSKCAGGSGGAGFHRFWIGIAVAGDFYVMPGATNACKLNSAGTKTLNTAGYNCVDPSASTNFPADQTTNASIAAGTVQSGLAFGNVRLLASADYALTRNALIGVRGGYVLRTDPAKGTPGAAFAPVHLEARVTYLFGRDALVAQTLSPMVLVGVGLGEFDASIPVSVAFSNMTASRSEDAWVTAGPFFLEAGGGARLKLGAGAAATGAIKIECAFGGTAGVLVGFAPELGIQLGF